MLLSLACAVATIWWGSDLSQSYWVRPADGGMLAPLPVRLAWGVGVGSLGVIFAAGMWVSTDAAMWPRSSWISTQNSYLSTPSASSVPRRKYSIHQRSWGVLTMKEGFMEEGEFPRFMLPGGLCAWVAGDCR